MTGVEGLWCFQSGTTGQPGPFNFGGVVVLAAGRVLGGDSTFALTGDYELQGGHIHARVCSTQWRKAIAQRESNFGGATRDPGYHVILEADHDGDVICGYISPEEEPDFQLSIWMHLVKALPR